MNGIANLGISLFILTLTGSMMVIIWSVFISLTDYPNYYPIIYRLLHIIALFYCLPILEVIIYIQKYDFKNQYTTGYFGLVTSHMNQIFTILFIFLLIGLIINIGLYIRSIYLVRIIKKKSNHAAKELQQLLEQCKKNLGITNKITLYVQKNIESAFTGGLLHPYIILPENPEYTSEDYETILIHELMHIKYHDVFWTWIMATIFCVHYFNPFVWYLSKQMNRWSEIHCDYEVCKIINNKKNYCQLLFSVAMANATTKKIFVMSFFKKENMTKERIKRISIYKNKPKIKTPLSVLLIIFMIISTGGMFCTSMSIVKAQESLYETTLESLEEENVLPENYLDEKTGNESDFKDFTIVDEVPNAITAYSMNNITWSINNKTVYRSANFKATSGKNIILSISIAPTNKKITAGIIDPDGVLRYVSGTQSIIHTFKVTKTGNYKIYIKNTSGTKVTVNGFYTY